MSPYDGHNTYSRPGTTWRECRECKRLWRERARGGSAVTLRSWVPGGAVEALLKHGIAS